MLRGDSRVWKSSAKKNRGARLGSGPLDLDKQLRCLAVARVLGQDTRAQALGLPTVPGHVEGEPTARK